MKQRSDVLRIIDQITIELEADAKTVFPLLCPVKEVDWIDGWEDVCTLVYTDSGIAEEACIFETDIPLEGKALWICSDYDAKNTQIEYIKHLFGKAIIKWRMIVRDLPGGRSAIHSVYVATSLGKEGKAYVKSMGDKGATELLTGLQERVNYYVTHGRMKRHLVEKAACHVHTHHAEK